MHILWECVTTLSCDRNATQSCLNRHYWVMELRCSRKGSNWNWIKGWNNIFRTFLARSSLCGETGNPCCPGLRVGPGNGPLSAETRNLPDKLGRSGHSLSLPLSVSASLRQVLPIWCQRWPEVAPGVWFRQLALLGDKKVFCLIVIATALGSPQIGSAWLKSLSINKSGGWRMLTRHSGAAFPH